MNKWQKIGVAVGLGGLTVSAVHIINKFIFSASVVKGVTDHNQLGYKWKFGNISYTKTGKGKPILLIHDLTSVSSTYEWKNIIKKLSKTHTVYALDLLGCGHSDKPNITYTAYLYVQMLTDFVTNIIGKRTDVVVTGDSCPLVIMSCYSNSNLFDKLFLVNPESIIKSTQIPNKKSNFLRILLNSPVIGTMIYNICMSKLKIKKLFSESLFNNSQEIDASTLNEYHESAHLHGASAKFLFTSTQGRYTTASIGRAVNEINNCMYIIAGEQANDMESIVGDYIDINPAIEVVTVPGCKHLPQLEAPRKFIKQLLIFL